MSAEESSCRTVIRAAAAGSAADREELARRYLGVVRAYLAARWRGSPLRDDLDDATQDVFVECFRAGGALFHAETKR
jgi:RNA polymerase sigma-70 factor (ECF subfamily)